MARLASRGRAQIIRSVAAPEGRQRVVQWWLVVAHESVGVQCAASSWATVAVMSAAPDKCAPVKSAPVKTASVKTASVKTRVGQVRGLRFAPASFASVRSAPFEVRSGEVCTHELRSVQWARTSCAPLSTASSRSASKNFVSLSSAFDKIRCSRLPSVRSARRIDTSARNAPRRFTPKEDNRHPHVVLHHGRAGADPTPPMPPARPAEGGPCVSSCRPPRARTPGLGRSPARLRSRCPRSPCGAVARRGSSGSNAYTPAARRVAVDEPSSSSAEMYMSRARCFVAANQVSSAAAAAPNAKKSISFGREPSPRRAGCRHQPPATWRPVQGRSIPAATNTTAPAVNSNARRRLPPSHARRHH